MRNPEDICLLCKVRHSTKTQSHIIPRFIAKSVFGAGQGKGFLLDTNKAHNPAKIVQDSAKEDYILCPECERYFEIIETYIAARIHNRLWDIRKAYQFEDTHNEGGVRRKVCLEVNPVIFRLFIYSIVWRCSISETYAHKPFKLDLEEEELLRNNLNILFSNTHAELVSRQENEMDKVAIIPFIISTCESFNNSTENMLFTNPYGRNPYYIELNEYGLMISFKPSKQFETLDFLVNHSKGNIKIGFYTVELWKELRELFVDQFVKVASKQAKEKGVELYTENIKRLFGR